MSSRLAGAAVAVLFCTSALAAGRTLPAKDLDTYARLKDARTLADLRQEGPGLRTSRAQADAEFQKALGAAGWTSQRYQEADGLIGDVIGYFQAVQDDPGQAEGYWDGTERVDAATVALVKGRLALLSGATERARQVLRAEQEAAILGRLATRADLQGRWRRDPEASRAHLASALHLGPDQVRDLLKDRGESTFTFSGDLAEGSELRRGATTSWKAPFRLDGRSIVFLVKGREERLQVGVKSPTELIFGAMGVPSGVYRKR